MHEGKGWISCLKRLVLPLGNPILARVFNKLWNNHPMKSKSPAQGKYLVGLSALLFIVGLFLPAVDLAPWLPGLNVFMLSFLGTLTGGAGSVNHFLACLMGATANILMLVTAFRILQGKRKLSFASAVAALGLALLVQLPLNGITHEGLRGLSFGYWFWVGAAGALSLAAWKQRRPIPAERLVQATSKKAIYQ